MKSHGLSRSDTRTFPTMTFCLSVQYSFILAIMYITAFRETLASPLPPSNLTIYLTSLWYDALGDWNKAHELINDMEDSTAAWVHAYLHRKEGDLGNAGYWYRKAGKQPSVVSLANEWTEIVNALLSNG